MTDAANNPELALADLLTSPKRRRFVINYVENGGKGTPAAEAAGFASPSVEQNRLLKDDNVRKAIAVHSKIVAAVAGESRDTVLGRIRNRANVDPGDYYKEEPLRDAHGEIIVRNGETPIFQELKRMSELTKEQRQCIKKITLNQHGYTFELHDATAADRDLARLMGLEPKEQEALSPEDAANLIAAALDRMDELDHTPAASE